MKYIFLFCLSLLSYTGFACLNEDHVTKSGKHNGDFYLRDVSFPKAFDKPTLEIYLKNLMDEKPVTDEDIRANKNDIAVTYVKLAKYAEAEKILSALYKKYPDNYNAVINLGTLYELQGKNEEALELIKKAVKINPESHGGSEWFHIKILEFKLKKIPDELISGINILGLFEIHKPANDIANDVSYQLSERMPFTPAPNMLMAKVLQEYGDFLADSVSIKAAYIAYEIGMDYDQGNVLHIKDKRDQLVPYFKKYKEDVPITKIYYVDKLIQAVDNNKEAVVSTILDKGINFFTKEEEKKKENSGKNIWVIGLTAAAVIGLLFFFFKRKKNNN